MPSGFDAAQRATLLRFALVSLAGTAVDFLVLWLLHTHFGLNVVVASLISTEASILNSFIWNQLWAFRGRAGRGSLLSRLITFNGLYASMFVITLVVVGGLTALFGSRYYLLYKAITLPLNFVWTYLWSTLFLWRHGAVARESAPARALAE
jgi:putative flippase GtrA